MLCWELGVMSGFTAFVVLVGRLGYGFIVVWFGCFVLGVCYVLGLVIPFMLVAISCWLL